MVLLRVRKDEKLATLGGRLFQATRSLKKVFTHVEPALIYDNFIRITTSCAGIFKDESDSNFE